MKLRSISKNIIKLISKEIIKPCSPTPRHLRTYKFSLLDQLVPDNYFSFVFFYSSSSSSSSSSLSRADKNTIDNLKNSLSKTLTHYYPLAGRVRDSFCIDCDDSGVDFVEAHASCNMSEVLENPEMNILEQFLPFNPYTNKKLDGRDFIFSVQLNHFDCGGLAIAFNCRHIVADAAAGVGFLKNWARIARGGGGGGGNSGGEIEEQVVVVDCTSIFPPNDKISSYSSRINEWQRSTECVTKRFIFDGDKISALKKEIMGDDDEESDDNVYRPSRFESVCALIWDSFIDMDRSANGSATTTAAASIPVNLRQRMNPPLPLDCIGNLIHPGTCFVDGGDEGVECRRSLARKIKEHTKMVNDEFVRKLYGGGVFANLYMEAVDEILKKGKNVNLYGFTGPIGLPYYEVDFGWGKPKWFSTVMRLHNIVVLLDTRDGKGIEAWVGLPHDAMIKFEQHPGILSYASFTPSPRIGI